jgi:hypothetical protein
MKARGNHIGSITDLMTSCRAEAAKNLPPSWLASCRTRSTALSGKSSPT